MPAKKIDFDVVRKIALTLPDVEESTIHGALSLKAGGWLLACPAIHRTAEPSVYYVTDHYLNYPTVLVRLSRIDRNRRPATAR